MQPYFMPYIGYWQLIDAADIFVVFDDVNYIKKGWINRNRILMNGTELLFTLPVTGVSQNKKIKEHYFYDGRAAKNKLWTTIHMAYGKSSQFADISRLIQNIITDEEDNISLYIRKSIEQICRYLNISTQIINSSEIDKDPLKKGEDKIIEICMKLEADTYVNPIGGMELYHKQRFSEQNMDLRFIKSEKFQYQQMSEDFIPGLSILDMLFNVCKSDLAVYLKKYSLIEGRLSNGDYRENSKA